jgi:hypothetical protein
VRFHPDVVDLATELVADEEPAPMAEALIAYLHLMSTDPGDLVTAREAHGALVGGGNEREQAHATAIGAWIDGGWGGAARSLDDLPADAIVLTTYGVVRREAEALGAVTWGLVAADEAQAVKNPLSRTARALRRIPAGARFALTGTPVENRLVDLWALLVSMAATWAQAAVMTTATRDEPVAVHERRRTALARAVDRAFSA